MTHGVTRSDESDQERELELLPNRSLQKVLMHLYQAHFKLQRLSDYKQRLTKFA